jgi:KH/beta-lactamase-domain protein
METIRNDIVKYFTTIAPKEAAITRIEYEGTKLAIYTKNPKIFYEQDQIARDLVSLIKKRVVIRSDPSIRLPKEKVENIIKEKLPMDKIKNIFFDELLGEIIIEAYNPDEVLNNYKNIFDDLTKITLWKPRIIKSPLAYSKTLEQIRSYMYGSLIERKEVLMNIGERIFRPILLNIEDLSITILGSGQQVGRSAILVETKESKVLIDCGIDPGANSLINQFPRFDAISEKISQLDAIIISHAHLDHSALVPYLFKYDFNVPVFCSEPTLPLMAMLQSDFISVAGKEGASPPYTEKDIRKMLLHAIPLKYKTVTNITPDIRLTLYNSGHILGSAIIHLHIGEGFHNIIYTSDFKFEKTRLLDASTYKFPKMETLIIESTYGNTFVPFTREDSEKLLASYIKQTIEQGGKALIPVPAVGRAQEILLVLDNLIKNNFIPEIPIFVDGLINEATAIHTAYSQYLSNDLRPLIDEGLNPFSSEYVTTILNNSQRDEVINSKNPCIILSTSGMLEGGPVLNYFREFSNDEKNFLIFVSYQVEGTLGRKLLKGIRDISLINENGKTEVIHVKMKIDKVDGFSGHSSRQQLLDYLRKVSPKPKNLIILHGEPEAIESIAKAANKIIPAKIYTPKNLDAIYLS